MLFFTNPVIRSVGPPEAAQRLSGIFLIYRDMNSGFFAVVTVRRYGSA